MKKVKKKDIVILYDNQIMKGSDLNEKS